MPCECKAPRFAFPRAEGGFLGLLSHAPSVDFSALGRILNPDGQPLAGLHGILERSYYFGHAPRGGFTDGAAEGGSGMVLTDKDGRFRIDGLIPGQNIAWPITALAASASWISSFP